MSEERLGDIIERCLAMERFAHPALLRAGAREAAAYVAQLEELLDDALAALDEIHANQESDPGDLLLHAQDQLEVILDMETRLAAETERLREAEEGLGGGPHHASPLYSYLA